MKSDKYLRLVVLILCGVVACYIVASVIRGPDEGYTLYKAVYYEVGGYTTSGFVVRSERPITGRTEGIVVYTRAEGERVGVGQTVAATFRDDEAKDRQDRIDELEMELSQMEYAYSFSSTGEDSATLDSDIRRLISQVALSGSRREYSQANASAEQLKTYILRRYLTSDDAQTLWERISETKDRLNQLYAQSETESGKITTPDAGYFSSVADGYELVMTPSFLETASVTQFRNLRTPLNVTNAVGKVVTSPKWYYATLVDPEKIAGLEAGDRVDVSFTSAFNQTLSMKVERISPSEEGVCLLVLSSERDIQEAVSARSLTADLYIRSYSGLLVPKDAIYVNEEGKAGVYVLEGAKAAWKSVEIIYDNGEDYLVAEDKSSIDNLWPEDGIILTKEELFEGKVMGK